MGPETGVKKLVVNQGGGGTLGRQLPQASPVFPNVAVWGDTNMQPLNKEGVDSFLRNRFTSANASLYQAKLEREKKWKLTIERDVITCNSTALALF